MTKWKVTEADDAADLEAQLNRLSEEGFHPLEIHKLVNPRGETYFLVIASREVPAATRKFLICGGAGSLYDAISGVPIP